MISLTQLWLPILVSAVFVFIASSVIHMVLQWHKPFYKGFANEDEVPTALGKSTAAAGVYLVPWCADMKKMAEPEMQAKFTQGPIAKVILRAGCAPSMGKPLVQWFVFCLVVSLFCAGIDGHTLAVGTPYMHVFCVTGMAAFLGYGFYTVPHGIWWGQPWSAVAIDVLDGLIYALVTAGAFGWLWPR